MIINLKRDRAIVTAYQGRDGAPWKVHVRNGPYWRSYEIEGRTALVDVFASCLTTLGEFAATPEALR